MLNCAITRRWWWYLIDLREATQEGGHLRRVGVEHGHQGSVRSSPSTVTKSNDHPKTLLCACTYTLKIRKQNFSLWILRNRCLFLYFIWGSVKNVLTPKPISPKPLSKPLWPFRLFSKICVDIRSLRCTIGVIDTGDAPWLANISANLRNNLKRILWGWGILIHGKTRSKKSRDTVPLNMKVL
jgi:hypothetical protein